jgi:hypothetical protein
MKNNSFHFQKSTSYSAAGQAAILNEMDKT